MTIGTNDYKETNKLEKILFDSKLRDLFLFIRNYLRVIYENNQQDATV